MCASPRRTDDVSVSVAGWLWIIVVWSTSLDPFLRFPPFLFSPVFQSSRLVFAPPLGGARLRSRGRGQQWYPTSSLSHPVEVESGRRLNIAYYYVKNLRVVWSGERKFARCYLYGANLRSPLLF